MAGFKKLRVLVIVYDSHLPPENAKGVDLQKVDWKMEFEVVSALRRMRQEVMVLGVGDDLSPLREAVEKFKPHVAVNLLDEFHNNSLYDQNVVSYLELLQLPYTGCNPRGLILSRDKGLTKKLLAYHKIPVPRFEVFPKNRSGGKPKDMRFPLIVKPLTEQASIGISQASIVRDDEKLKERVEFIHNSIGSDAIAESYIDGRELYVGLLGNTRIDALPVWELHFGKVDGPTHKIATRRAKWDPNYIERMGIKVGRAKNLTSAQVEEIQSLCKNAYRILGLSGYARMDLRLMPDGQVFIVEANPNPHIGQGEALAESASRAGISYEDLLWRILNLGLSWRSGTARAA